MKVESPSKTRGVGSARKTDKAKDTSGDFARALDDESADETASTAAIPTAPVGAIDALLSAQEISGEDDRSAMAKARGEELLERLEELRQGLLTGHLSVDKLDALVSLIGTERQLTSDPGLAETLDAIELLAKVELAKLGRDV
ncbi:MAG: flagellar assembly protein FliX [Alphaproteobacteria bacterium]|nr:flagellar assembly protein FliX [Alphaproteobacteria bacterium]